MFFDVENENLISQPKYDDKIYSHTILRIMDKFENFAPALFGKKTKILYKNLNDIKKQYFIWC